MDLKVPIEQGHTGFCQLSWPKLIQACVLSSDIINQMQILSCLRDCDDSIHLPFSAASSAMTTRKVVVLSVQRACSSSHGLVGNIWAV